MILGAGLAGLSAAYHFNKMGCENWLVLEKDDRVGGLLRVHML
ncbi:MAG: NAD(P)-binding protein [Nitrospinota bacterium]